VDSTLVIVGLSARTSPEAVRERFWLDEVMRSEVAAKLARSEGISEAVLLVTNSRIEYIVWADDPSDAANSILLLLSNRFGLKLCEWEHFYRLTDTPAVTHVFTLACESGTDENESSAELRSHMQDAWIQARNAGISGRMLDLLFTKAFALADRIKASTAKPSAVIEMIAADARSFPKELVAERVVPATAALRVRVEDICRQELETFEQELGPISESQRNSLAELKVRVTKRIAGEVEHGLKGLKQTVAYENSAETAQRLISHGHMRDLVNRSQN
jgi:glutamyl-tRNA reductase